MNKTQEIKHQTTVHQFGLENCEAMWQEHFHHGEGAAWVARNTPCHPNSVTRVLFAGEYVAKLRAECRTYQQAWMKTGDTDIRAKYAQALLELNKLVKMDSRITEAEVTSDNCIIKRGWLVRLEPQGYDPKEETYRVCYSRTGRSHPWKSTYPMMVFVRDSEIEITN